MTTQQSAAASLLDETPAAGPRQVGELLFRAARRLLRTLERGERMERRALREAMTGAFGLSDAQGGWSWKEAYDAAEGAMTLFLLRYGRRILRSGLREGLGYVERAARLEPPHTYRSEEQIRMQQFSTPPGLAYAVAAAARIEAGDLVLEPSAGTGTLAVMAAWRLEPERQGRLLLNELARNRADLLDRLFPQVAVTRLNGEHIGHLLETQPGVVVMNPPFSRRATGGALDPDADLKHVRSAYRLLRPGGRLVAVTSAHCIPDGERWRRACQAESLQPIIRFTAEVGGQVYAARGTRFASRLTVVDKPTGRGEQPDSAVDTHARADTAADLLELVTERVPHRLALQAPARRRRKAAQPTPPARRTKPLTLVEHNWGPVERLKYEPVHHDEQACAEADDAGPYAPWRPETIRVRDAFDHPTALVQTQAMAAVRHPAPKYQPTLPSAILRQGRLSAAQLESVALAGEAHEQHLPAWHLVSRIWERSVRVDVDGEPSPPAIAHAQQENPGEHFEQAPVRFRQAWMLGDGTGCGKGRQVAAIIAGHWLQGRRRALWLSQSDKLIEDARRDWAAVGGSEVDVVPIRRIKQGQPIRLAQGVLFSTYASLRTAERQGRKARLDQIIEWLAGGATEQARHAYDGVVVFDEAHAMANAVGKKGAWGDVLPSQQGLAGLRLQNALPDARVVYVSATGASTVHGLAYAKRLGLWATALTPFATREHFVQAMERGGVAALEVVARDLKALGLYQARALAYDGVEIDMLRHALTGEQRAIYDEYAHAFQIIHDHLDEALELTGVNGDDGGGDRAARAAALSAFEGAKQRFFNHLLTAMKTPTLIRSVERDIAEGRAAVIQIVSTGEALMERRIEQIPVSEWDDLSIDMTPREYVLDYLRRAFPLDLYEEYADEEGNIRSRKVLDPDGNPVQSRIAVRMRDELIERLGAMPPVPAALDQLIHHFGAERVAEITGRARRVVRVADHEGERLAVRTRPDSANLSEAQEFMAGKKLILVFSGAGGTGRSYHADAGCGNRRRRVHYLLEAGWRADQAIQGLGRSHRTHQVSAPVFRPVTTDVKAERRFISTIAKRLDALGAITRGQRNAQSAMGDDDRALFHASDNFESVYAHKALRQFYYDLVGSRIDGWSEERFHRATGLALATDGGTELKHDTPPMPTFLNRLLALPIDDQNELFEHLEELIEGNLEQAIESGTYNQGVEDVDADEIELTNTEMLATHERTGATTRIAELVCCKRTRPLKPEAAIGKARKAAEQRGRADEVRLVARRLPGKDPEAAVVAPAPSWLLDNGGIQPRVRLLQPDSQRTQAKHLFEEDGWGATPAVAWTSVWEEQMKRVPMHVETRIWLVTGLLLPYWNRLQTEDMKIRRAVTRDGRRLVGRLVSLAEVNAVRVAFGLEGRIRISAAEMWKMLTETKSKVPLSEGKRLLCRRVMGQPRVEIHGVDYRTLADLKRRGCKTEVIAYETRVFVPDQAVLERVLDRYAPDGAEPSAQG